MEYRRQEFGGGNVKKELLVKYESYLSSEIHSKLKEINMEEKLPKYLNEVDVNNNLDVALKNGAITKKYYLKHIIKK